MTDLTEFLSILNTFQPKTSFFDVNSLNHVDFLFAAASLRAFQFGISVKGFDKYRMQEIAGNIVPAVCFSNGLIGALAVRAMLEDTSDYLLTNKKSPYVRRDVLSESSRDCCVCGIATWRVGESELIAFLQNYENHSIYSDGKCVKQQLVESESQDGWFSGEEAEDFIFRSGQFLVVFAGEKKFNVIVTAHPGSELLWSEAGPPGPGGEIDIDSDSSDLEVMQ